MIKLCYKNFELGVLDFDKNSGEFIYNSNLGIEEKAKTCGAVLDFYPFFNSKNIKWKNLPMFFNEFVICLTREDIVQSSGIKKEDSLFEKLEKLASLKLNKDGFYLKV